MSVPEGYDIKYIIYLIIISADPNGMPRKSFRNTNGPIENNTMFFAIKNTTFCVMHFYIVFFAGGRFFPGRQAFPDRSSGSRSVRAEEAERGTFQYTKITMLRMVGKKPDDRIGKTKNAKKICSVQMFSYLYNQRNKVIFYLAEFIINQNCSSIEMMRKSNWLKRFKALVLFFIYSIC